MRTDLLVSLAVIGLMMASVPAKGFWVLTLYDTQTSSQLQTDQQFPTLGSQTEGIYDIYSSSVRTGLDAHVYLSAAVLEMRRLL